MTNIQFVETQEGFWYKKSLFVSCHHVILESICHSCNNIVADLKLRPALKVIAVRRHVQTLPLRGVIRLSAGAPSGSGARVNNSQAGVPYFLRRA
jgi:hypothetical protein